MIFSITKPDVLMPRERRGFEDELRNAADQPESRAQGVGEPI
jgi:hypothetical protein